MAQREKYYYQKYTTLQRDGSEDDLSYVILENYGA